MLAHRSIKISEFVQLLPQVSPDVSSPPEFFVVGYRQRRVLEVLLSSDLHSALPLQVLTSGNYSRLCADILFKRSTGYYIIQVVLLPS